MKSIFLASACACGIFIFAASPAHAQNACDLNGVIQPAPAGTSSLTCGTILADFGPTGANRTLVGTSIVVDGANTTAVGSNIQISSQSFANVSGPYVPPAGSGATSIGSYSFAFGEGSVAVGDKAGVGVYFEENGFANIRAVANGTAVGSSARASADRASAIGSFAIASGVDSTALGSDAVASAEGSVALGRGSLADQANTVSVGTVDRERRIVNVAAGVGDTDAVIVSQLNAEAAIRADADTTLQNNITAVGTRVDGVEAINAAQQTQISTIQTVNTSQSTQISANTAALSGVQAVNTIQSAQISALSGQFAAFNTNISGIQADIGSLFDLRRQDRSDTRQGIASAIAMGSAPIPSRPGGVSYNVNAARFRGENAIGGSMMYRLNTGSTVAVGAGFSYAGNKNNGVRLGVAGEF